MSQNESRLANTTLEPAAEKRGGSAASVRRTDNESENIARGSRRASPEDCGEDSAWRYRLAYDADMVTAVLDVFVKAVFRHLQVRVADYRIDQTHAAP